MKFFMSVAPWRSRAAQKKGPRGGCPRRGRGW